MLYIRCHQRFACLHAHMQITKIVSACLHAFHSCVANYSVSSRAADGKDYSTFKPKNKWPVYHYHFTQYLSNLFRLVKEYRQGKHAVYQEAAQALERIGGGLSNQFFLNAYHFTFHTST